MIKILKFSPFECLFDCLSHSLNATINKRNLIQFNPLISAQAMIETACVSTHLSCKEKFNNYPLIEY